MAQGSPPFSLGSLDWKSILWTLGTAAMAAVLTAAADSVLPDLKDKGLIDAGLFVLLTSILHAARKWLTDTRVGMFLVVCLSLLAGSAMATDPVVLKPGDLADGNHPVNIVVRNGQIVSVLPLRTVVLGGQPTPTPTPDPTPDPQPAPSPVSEAVKVLTQQALDAGASKTSGAAIAFIYSSASAEVSADRLAPDKAFAFTASATETILGFQPDKAKWDTFRAELSRVVLTPRQEAGTLQTKEQVSTIMAQIAQGMDAATGFDSTPKSVIAIMEATAAERAQMGILEGLDIERLTALLNMIITLLKLFGIGG